MELFTESGLPDEINDIARDADGHFYIPETTILRVSDEHPAQAIVKAQIESTYADSVAFEIFTARFIPVIGMIRNWAAANDIDAGLMIFHQEPVAHFWLLFTDDSHASAFEEIWIKKYGGNKGLPCEIVATRSLDR